MTNRLVSETSPYLRQHAENPVDWYPWGPEALERARREDRPMLVSIGYSACHWCHVMAHESFEDPRVAEVMNQHFVNIKVDREERPDVDAIYMEAVQALTGAGGWPLNVFLTSDGRPFYGGTYFPPDGMRGIPGWRSVLLSIADAYARHRTDVSHNAGVLTEYLQRAQNLSPDAAALDRDILHGAIDTLKSRLDWSYGGFGSAPKFPQPLALDFMLRMWQRTGDPRILDFVRLTLDAMAAGGIRDQLGGGFHRYSVDDSWLVPHFEKMLYDNALLARTYTQAYCATGERRYREVAESTLDYLLRDMLSPDGAFYSAEDADSEGHEGKFYLWSLPEVQGILGPDAELACHAYGIRPQGNFEGSTILTAAASPAAIASERNLPREDVTRRLETIRERLLAARSERIRPAKDTKILAAWNALAIRSLAEAGRTFEREDYLLAAERTVRFVLDRMCVAGRLRRSWHGKPSAVPAFLEDHAFLIEALISLYETTFRTEYLRDAEALVHDAGTLFGDQGGGPYFDAPSGDDLIVRPRSLFDNPIPSGNAALAFGLLRLAALTGDAALEQRAEPAFRAARSFMARAPLGFPCLLSALDMYLSTPLQIAIVVAGEASTLEFVATVFARYLPNKVVAVGRDGDNMLLSERPALDGESTAYVCEHFTCRLPTTDSAVLGRQLDEATSTPGS